MDVSALLVRRCTTACATFPTTADWEETALLLIALSTVASTFGKRSGFLVRQTAFLPVQTVALIAVGCFFSPALVEEIVFRVLPVPLAGEASQAARLEWAAISLVVFVLYHPIRAWLWPRRREYRVFLDKRFLVLASLLGLCCTITYLRSGSVWPGVFIHWICVVVWIVFYGGYEKMRPQSGKEED